MERILDRLAKSHDAEIGTAIQAMKALLPIDVLDLFGQKLPFADECRPQNPDSAKPVSSADTARSHSRRSSSKSIIRE
jgi:hypothetical protein